MGNVWWNLWRNFSFVLNFCYNRFENSVLQLSHPANCSFILIVLSLKNYIYCWFWFFSWFTLKRTHAMLWQKAIIKMENNGVMRILNVSFECERVATNLHFDWGKTVVLMPIEFFNLEKFNRACPFQCLLHNNCSRLEAQYVECITLSNNYFDPTSP